AEAWHVDIVRLLLTKTAADAADKHAMRQRALSHAARGDSASLVRLLFATVGVDPYSDQAYPSWMRLPRNTTYKGFNIALEFLYLIGSTETEEWRKYSAEAMLFAA